MAAEFFLYTTLYDNTLVNRSNTSFAPLPPDTGEIEIDYFIPIIQPLYYYRESGTTIVLNSEETINEYLKGTAPPPEPDDNVLTYTFTGYTGTTDTRLNGMDTVISGNTTGVTANTAAINVSNELIVINYDLITGNTTGITTNKADISLLADEVAINITDIADNATGITNNSAAISINAGNINTRVYRSGDTMTGSLSTSGNLTAVGAVTGLSVSAGSCLCSVGTTQLEGGVTAASFLNVSGVTTFGDVIYMTNPNTGGTLNDWFVRYDPVSCLLRTIPATSDVRLYCYVDKKIIQSNTTSTNATYLTSSWSLSAGHYESEFNAVYGNTSSNRCAVVCFLVDGVVVGSCNLMKTNASTVRTTAYITQNSNLSNGTHTISMVFKQLGGGIAQIHYGAMRVQRISDCI